MKQINISVNLEENEVLQDSIKKALIGQAKQIAREELEKTLISEIERVTTAKINDIKTPYYSAMANRIADEVVKKMAANIQMDTLIEEKVAAYLDSKFQKEGALDKHIQRYMDKTIASALMQRANKGPFC